MKAVIMPNESVILVATDNDGHRFRKEDMKNMYITKALFGSSMEQEQRANCASFYCYEWLTNVRTIQLLAPKTKQLVMNLEVIV